MTSTVNKELVEKLKLPKIKEMPRRREAAYYGSSLISHAGAQDTFVEWFQEHVIEERSGRTKLVTFHEDYVDYLENNTKQIPLSKRTFMRLFKESIELLRLSGQVRLITHSAIEFLGLGLKERFVFAEVS